MIKRLALLCLLALSVSSNAATVTLDSLKVGTVTYKNVTVLGANETDLYFTHQKGIANVKLKYLSSDLQKKFNYDPKVAEEAEKRRAEEESRYHDAVAASVAAEAQKAANAALPAVVDWADPVSDTSLLGKPAPALAVDKWLTSEPARTNKYVLVAFWAAGSAPCRRAIPQLNALQKKFAGNLVVVGVTTDSERTVADLKEPKLEFASAIDTKGKYRKAAGITSIPSVLLIDRKGIVRYAGHPAAVTEAALEPLFPKPAE